jgi:hypothetical protein
MCKLKLEISQNNNLKLILHDIFIFIIDDMLEKYIETARIINYI